MKISPLLSLVGLVPSSLREQGNLLMTNVCVPIAVYVSIDADVSVDVVVFTGRNTRCSNRIRDGARDSRKIQLQ